MTITLPDWLPYLLVAPGWILVFIGICPDRWWRMLCLLVGMFLVVSGGNFNSIAPTPPPVPPAPGPGPAPVPVPTGVFSDQVRTAFVGTKQQRQSLSILFGQAAGQVAFDATRNPPEIKTVNVLGRWWAEAQRNRELAMITSLDAQHALKDVMLNEIRRRGCDVSLGGPLDATKRMAFISTFQEASAALQ